ncbi:anti-sigma factor [Actinospica sp. MGRD01-02]|uniref:Regulator of SigK n=1 Tax=Actinospica acidithermotolerans TaxID=2828514 RepID=A0A941E8Y2_9ACTN|nr:anti-sigma factor [Actinospica acidithermotolerans]MBR7828470.1 anti-sigma factor [Actinospica acidithermotolerans]
MTEADVHTLTGAYVCDALGEGERAAFEQHMAQCPECAAEVRELREVGAVMADAVATRPPASLKDAVDARIRVTRQDPPLTDPHAQEPQAAVPAQRGSAQRRRAAWAIAAVLALVVAGLGWRVADQQNQINALNAQSTQISQLLAAPDASATRVPVTGGGTALVVDSRSRNEVAVSFTGVASAPSGKIYQLWLMTATGAARSVGLMESTPNHPLLVEGLAGETAVGMTIEPSGGSVKPTTLPVMVAALEA